MSTMFLHSLLVTFFQEPKEKLVNLVVLACQVSLEWWVMLVRRKHSFVSISLGKHSFV